MFLIDEKYLKNTVNVTTHKDAQEIKIAFNTVAEFYIKDLLSLPLYELYLSHVTSKTPLSAKKGELLEKVKLYYALQTQFELMFNLFTVSNQGNQENPNAPSIQDVREKRNEVKSKAETVKAKILDFLSKNKSDFPEWYGGSDDASGTPKAGSDFSPIVFY